MSVEVRFRLNGRQVARSVPDERFLCDLLRDDLALTGTKVGCREGVCGSCTVLLDGRPVRSCLLLAAQVDGRVVETVEALAADGRLGAVQRAFVEHGALQCGFCTPGFLMTATALVREGVPREREAIVEALAGNLCRCTGYGPIVEAVADACAQALAQGSS